MELRQLVQIMSAGLVANYWVMVQNPASLITWIFQIVGRFNDPCQPSAWRVDASNDGNTFTTLFTSNAAVIFPAGGDHLRLACRAGAPSQIWRRRRRIRLIQ